TALRGCCLAAATRPAGRLSVVATPARCKASRAASRPAPVMATSSQNGGSASASVTAAVYGAQLEQLLDAQRDGHRHARDCSKLVDAGLLDAVDAAELAQQCPLARRPEPAHHVE